jgi:hypothetical protein
MEPGDATRYEFIVSDGWYREGYLTATCLHLECRGYTFLKEEVDRFNADHGPIPSYADYSAWGEKVLASGDPFLLYVLEHTKANPWTALALIVALIIGGGMLEGGT